MPASTTATSNPQHLSLVSQASGVDPVEARWAAEAVANLSRQLDADSVVALILRRTHRELLSLSDGAHDSTAGRSHVVGPVRLRVAG